MISGQRFVSSARRSLALPQYDYNKRARAEIDGRADTVCAGSTFHFLEESNHYCVAYGFHSDMKPIENVPVATVATAYDQPSLQETIILIFHEALYFGDSMEHSLLCPMQLRHNGIKVDQSPRQYDPASIHGLLVPQEEEEDLYIPFALIDLDRNVGAASVTSRTPQIDAGSLSKRFGISHYRALLTLRGTTQLAV